VPDIPDHDTQEQLVSEPTFPVSGSPEAVHFTGRFISGVQMRD
jgi:hypothetical protein